MYATNADLVARMRSAVQRERLLDTAIKLIEVPSPTRSGGAAADRLEGILRAEGFEVERPVAGWPEAPAVAVRWQTGRAGRTLQFNGHLDTVHLPFVPPRVADGVLYGSGASDMKGGIAAMVEALRVLRDLDCLPAGGVLLTAHDLHESPWGDGSQIDNLIAEGYVGDAVLLPEYLCDRLPVVGRGLAILQVTIAREGVPQHEVLGGIEQPSVIVAGANLVLKFADLDRRLASLPAHPLGVRESVFVGQVASGEIYNQAPVEFRLSGTRRWLAPQSPAAVERKYRQILDEVALETLTHVNGEFLLVRDACELDITHAIVPAFQAAHEAVTGRTLPLGAKPFVDDGNTFIARGRVPAITHGPNAQGAHTLHETVPVDELVRVAAVYALTALAFCPG
jgi:acetylornithine deacetylase/succinyl-diaminopimelate desuccinylase-like protein